MLLTGWLVVAAALVTGMSSCSGEDSVTERPVASVEPVATSGTTVHISVGACVDSPTRSAVDETTSETGKTLRTLRFTADPADRLFITAELPSQKYLAGWLEIDESSLSADGKSATFSGDLAVYDNDGTPTNYTFTNPDPLAECSEQSAHLVAGGFEGYDVILNYSYDVSYERCLTSGEDRLSRLMTSGLDVISKTYTTEGGFTDFQGDAIINCTISGLQEGIEYTVRLINTEDEQIYEESYNNDNLSESIRFVPTFQPSDDGTATFAFPLKGVGDRYISLKLSDAEENNPVELDVQPVYIRLGKVTTAKNKVYNIKRTFFNLNYEGDYEIVVKDGDILTGTRDYSICTIPDGATITLQNVTLENSYIYLKGAATIILEGTNTVRASDGEGRAGIYVPRNRSLTIMGNGSLTAIGDDQAAGIGGDKGACGNITIKAPAKVTAIKGENADYSIGPGRAGGYCGTITIGDDVTGPISESPFTWPQQGD
jgi:hypothetical protein